MNRTGCCCESHGMAPVALDIDPDLRFALVLMGEPSTAPEQARATDEDLLVAVASEHGDQALANLYDRYAKRIYGLGLHQLGASTLAEELVQETFVRVWQGAFRFDPSRGSAATFIFTIARRQAIDLWRRRSARPAETPEADDAAMPNAVDRLLVGLAVREAIDELSEAHRQVIELAHGRGLSQVEIAAHLGIPLGTVKTRTYHALRALRSALQQRGIDG